MSEEALAKHWGVTTRYVRILREEEVAVFKGGKYDLVESDRRLINWLKTDEPTQRVKRELSNLDR